MSTHRFSPNTEFAWEEQPYRVTRILPDHVIEIENLFSWKKKVVVFLDLYRALVDGQIKFSTPGQEPAPPPKISLEDFSHHQQKTARYRLQVIEPLLKIRASRHSAQDIDIRVEEVKKAQQLGNMPEMPISRISVYRWLNGYIQSGNDIRALIPKKRKSDAKKRMQNPDRVEQIIQEVINERYFVREQVKIDDIHHEVILRIDLENQLLLAESQLTAPSRATIWRRIGEVDERRKLMAKKGKRAAKKELTQYGQMDSLRFALERVEIDHTITDIFVVDEKDNLPLGRLTLTLCLDGATRYPLGFYLGFEPPGYLTVASCLHHAILPKPDVQSLYNTAHSWRACGVPNMLVVDNAMEFVGPSLPDACHSLGILLQRLPVKTPHYKGMIERFFRTINTGLLHALPGTTFANFNTKGDYDSLHNACLNPRELNKALHIFLLDIYAESPHRGLNQDTPANRWKEAQGNGFLPRVPTDPNELAILLGRIDERTIQHYGIDFQCIRYNHGDLALLRHRLETESKGRGTTGVKIKYLPDNLGSIFVFDPYELKYIEVPAIDQAYAQGLSLYTHKFIRLEALKSRPSKDNSQIKMKELAIARRKIQEVVSEGIKKIRKNQPRKNAARLKEGIKNFQSIPSTPTLANLPGWLTLDESNNDQVEKNNERSNRAGWRVEK